MSNTCEITNERAITGNLVSHAHNKTKRKFYPNLQKKKFFLKTLNTSVALHVCTKAIRTISKNGLYPTLKKAAQKGTLAPRLAHLVKAK